MVTHSSTSRPVQCLCMAERTGCPVFTDLWSYVSTLYPKFMIYPDCKAHNNDQQGSLVKHVVFMDVSTYRQLQRNLSGSINC